MWWRISWPVALVMFIAFALETVCVWYVGFSYAAHQCLDREFRMSEASHEALLEAHGQSIALAAQLERARK